MNTKADTDDYELRQALGIIYPQLQFSIIWNHSKSTRKKRASIYMEGQPLSKVDICYIFQALKRKKFSFEFNIVGFEEE